MNKATYTNWLHSTPVVLIYRLLLVMVVYTVSRGIFYLYNADLLHIEGSAQLLRIFRGGVMFDLSAMLYLNALIILLHLLPIPQKYGVTYQKWTTAIYWICNIPAFIFNLGDTIYYRFTGGRTTLSVFTEFANEDPLRFLRFFTDYWHLTLIGIALIVLWVLAYRAIKVGEKSPLSGWPFYVVDVALLPLVVVLFIGGVRGGFTLVTRPIAPNHASLYIARPEQRAMVLNTPFAMMRLAGKQTLPEWNFMPPAEAHKLFNAEGQADPEHSKYYGAYKGRNVVIIIWESFAREWVGALNKDIKGYKGFTPFVDSLLTESYYFTKATAGGTKSIDAMPSILASVLRPLSPFVSSIYSGNKVNSVASFARRHGYTTRFYHNAPNGSMGFDAMANQLGFESYHGKDEYNNDKDYDGNWGIWDEEFLQYIAKDLNTLKQPFLASEFTTSSHPPFIIPDRYKGVFPEGKIPMHRSIGYSDYSLRRFFETARKQPWYNNTLFIITADHAVGGDLEEYKNAVGAHAIPLIIFDPQGKLKGEDAEKLVQQTDILPTLMALLGFNDRYVAFGKDIFLPDGERFTVNTLDNAFQMRQGNYVLQFDGTTVLGLYDLSVDPGLKTDIKQKRPDVIAKMLPRFKAFLQDFSYRMRENKLSAD